MQNAIETGNTTNFEKCSMPDQLHLLKECLSQTISNEILPLRYMLEVNAKDIDSKLSQLEARLLSQLEERLHCIHHNTTSKSQSLQIKDDKLGIPVEHVGDEYECFTPSRSPSSSQAEPIGDLSPHTDILSSDQRTSFDIGRSKYIAPVDVTPTVIDAAKMRGLTRSATIHEDLRAMLSNGSQSAIYDQRDVARKVWMQERALCDPKISAAGCNQAYMLHLNMIFYPYTTLQIAYS